MPQSLPTERDALLPTSPTSSTLTDEDPNAGSELHHAAATVSGTRGAIIAVALFVLIFILTSNVSLLTTIQSPIATDLEAYSSVSWFTSTYLIALTSITPLAGRLGQIFTPRIYLFVSILVQCIGLLITALAGKLSVFLLGRVITGIGTAAVTPVAFILVTDLASKKRRGLFFGCINTAYTTGVALGAIIAGALEPPLGWRAVFWVQLPVTFTAATVALFAIPRPHNSYSKLDEGGSSIRQNLAQIDYFGVFSLIGSVVLLLYSLASPRIPITPIILSALLLFFFILIEVRWATDPIVPVPVLKSRGNLLTGLATIGLMTARWGILFYTPVYAIAVRTWSPASAGLMLLPANGGFALGGILAGWLHIRRAGSFYLASLLCYVLFAISLFGISQITTASSSIPLYIIMLFTNGFITGALLNYTLAHVLHLTLPETHIIVIPLNAMFRGLSGSFGSSVSGGLFLRTLHSTLESSFRNRGLDPDQNDRIAGLIAKLIGTPALVRSLNGVEREVAIDGYQQSLTTLFAAGSALALITALVQAGTGWTAPSPPPRQGDDMRSHAEDSLSPVISHESVGT